MKMTAVQTPGGRTAPPNATNHDRKFVENMLLGQISIPKNGGVRCARTGTTKERAAGRCARIGRCPDERSRRRMRKFTASLSPGNAKRIGEPAPRVRFRIVDY